MTLSNLEISVNPFDRKAKFRVLPPASVRSLSFDQVVEFEIDGLDDEAIKMLFRAVTGSEQS